MAGKGLLNVLQVLGLALAMGAFLACVPFAGSSEPLDAEPEYALAPAGADEVGAGDAFPFRPGEEGVLRVLAAQASDTEIMAFYHDKLASYGWMPRDDVLPREHPERAVIGWAKGDLRFRLAFWHGLEGDSRTIFSIVLYRDDG